MTSPLPIVPAAQINPYIIKLTIIHAPGDPPIAGSDIEQFPVLQFRQSGSNPTVAFSTCDCSAMTTIGRSTRRRTPTTVGSIYEWRMRSERLPAVFRLTAAQVVGYWSIYYRYIVLENCEITNTMQYNRRR